MNSTDALKGLKTHELHHLEDECYAAITAAENWARHYRKTPAQFKTLTRTQSSLNRTLGGFFKDQATRVAQKINWSVYYSLLNQPKEPAPVKAADFSVDVQWIDDEGGFWDAEDGAMLQVVYPGIATATVAGAQSAEELTKINMAVSPLTTWVQKAAQQHAAELVTGINQTTRDRLKQSLETSLELGEDNFSAQERLMGLIDSDWRALMISRTEAVSAWNKGVGAFGDKTGATSKTWHVAAAPCPICAANDEQTVGLDDSFDSGDDEPPAHPNCMCSISLNYPDGGDSGDGLDYEY